MRKNWKKWIAILVAGTMCFALAACGSSDEAEEESAEESVEESSEESTEEAEEEAAEETTEASVDYAAVAEELDGVLVMATESTFPPYEYVEGDEIVGIDVDISQVIADELGVELQIEAMDFGSIIVAVQSGKVDIGIAGMTVTEERLENVNFSDSYATGVQVIIVPEDSPIETVDDLDGVMIGVQESTTGHIYCEDDYGADHVTSYTTSANAVEALLTGKVDCVVIDNEPAKAFVEENEGLKILDTEYVVEDYAIAIAKENTDLLDAINSVLAGMKSDGRLDEIISAYIN